MNILVSACFLGINCKYSGGNNDNLEVAKLLQDYNVIPVCPEQLGGLQTPRPAAEIRNGTGEDIIHGRGSAKIVNAEGKDVTSSFIRGAREVLKLAKLYDCKIAVLKARSPSCGCGSIYDGTFSGKLREGNGVCAQLLLENGVRVINEEELYFLNKIATL